METSLSAPLHVCHVATVDLTVRFLLLPQLRALRDEGYRVTAISAPGPWMADVEREGIRHLPWPHATRAWSPGSDARAFASLLSIFRRERFDVVHTHNPKPGVLGRVAARAAGVPCVVNTVHGLYAMPEDRLGRKAAVLPLEWVAARFSDLELYQSEEDLRWARRIGVAPRWRSRLLGNGTDLARFDPAAVPAERIAALRRQLGVPPEALVVGTVGRMVAEKGYRELFAAARTVARELPGTRFVAVGGRDAGKWDAVTAEEIADSEAVTVLPWRDDVRDLLALFDMFVLPSWREGVPRSAIEAAAMGLPLVLSDVRGCREVGRHGREALLVPPRDPGALADAILALLRDAELRAAMGKAARRRAEERFDERRVIQVLLDAYRELGARKGLELPPPLPSARSLRVRRATAADAPAIARLHRQRLPEAFLPTLGEPFLVRLYRALASDPAAVTVVSEDERGVVGFASGVPSVRAFYGRFAVRHGVPAAAVALPQLVRPRTLRRALETAKYGAAGGDLPDAELLSIAVDGRARGTGTATALVDAVVRGLYERGAREVKVVVAADNTAGNRLYERTGFGLARRVALHDQRPSNVWVYRWPSS